MFAETPLEEVRDILFRLVLNAGGSCWATNSEYYVVQPFVNSYLAAGGDVNIVSKGGLPLITALMCNESDDTSNCARFELVLNALQYKPRLDYTNKKFCPIIKALRSQSPVRAASYIYFCDTKIPWKRMFFFIQHLLTIDPNLRQKNNKRLWLHSLMKCPDVSLDLLELLIPYCDIHCTKNTETLIYNAVCNIRWMKEMDTRTNIMVTEIIPKLLTLGCAVENVMDTSMPSPLLEASRLAMMDARPNHWDLITTLIQGGANVNASWPGGDIKINCNNSYVDLWETPGDTFFHRLINLQRSDEYGHVFNPFLYNIYVKNVISVAKKLLEYGANINARNCFGLTPLWNAIIATCSCSVVHPVVRMLIQENADVLFLRTPTTDWLKYSETLVAPSVYQWPNTVVRGYDLVYPDTFDLKVIDLCGKGFFEQLTMLGTATSMGNIPLVEILLLAGVRYATKTDADQAKKVVAKLRERCRPWSPMHKFKTENDSIAYYDSCTRVLSMLNNNQPFTLRNLARNVVRQTIYTQSPRVMQNFLPRLLIDILTLKHLDELPLIEIEECSRYYYEGSEDDISESSDEDNDSDYN